MLLSLGGKSVLKVYMIDVSVAAQGTQLFCPWLWIIVY